MSVFEDGSLKKKSKKAINHLSEDNSAFIIPHYDVR